MSIFDQIDAAIDAWIEQNGTNPNTLLLGNAERTALLKAAHDLQLMSSTYLKTIDRCRIHSVLTDQPVIIACRMQVTYPSKEERTAEILATALKAIKDAQ